MPTIPKMRQLFHQNIHNNQNAIIKLNSHADTLFTATKDDDVNLQITQFLKVRITNLQARIESDTTISENDKYTWLRGVNQLLTDFINAYKAKQIKGIALPDLIIAFEEAMQYDRDSKSIAPVAYANDIEIAALLTQNFALQKKCRHSRLQEYYCIETLRAKPR